MVDITGFEELEPQEVDVAPAVAAQFSAACAMDPTAIGRAMEDAFGKLATFVQQHGLLVNGPPRAVYTSYSADTVSFTVALPLGAPPSIPTDVAPITVGEIPSGRTLRFTHRGPYRGLMATYGQVTQFLKTQGLLTSEADWARYMPMWEEYLNDPRTTPEADLLTYIYLPLTPAESGAS
jgi:effector-binding domain-containing protein